MILVACAGVLYYLQSLLSLHGVEDEMQREQIKKMIYMSPLMIVVFSLFSPASVTLYWVVGGFMMILQQFIVNYIVRPKLRKKVREELAKNPPKASAFSKPSGRKDVTLNNQLLSQARKNTKIATLENNVRDKKKRLS